MINDGTENHFNLGRLAQDYNVIKYPGQYSPLDTIRELAISASRVEDCSNQMSVTHHFYCHSISTNKIEVLDAGRLNSNIGKVQMSQISEKKFNLFCREK